MNRQSAATYLRVCCSDRRRFWTRSLCSSGNVGRCYLLRPLKSAHAWTTLWATTLPQCLVAHHLYFYRPATPQASYRHVSSFHSLSAICSSPLPWVTWLQLRAELEKLATWSWLMRERINKCDITHSLGQADIEQ
ncbi:uncharacterized protein LOC144132254 [Amblyomma americanum]